jgi:hypothetical protein
VTAKDGVVGSKTASIAAATAYRSIAGPPWILPKTILTLIRVLPGGNLSPAIAGSDRG